MGTEPYICTNAGTGTPEEMSDWIEYCNLTVGKFAKMREANGHKEPFNVKYWSIGNENWGGHELGARTIQEWGPMVRESAKLMRSVTKDAKLFAAATSDKIGQCLYLLLLEIILIIFLFMDIGTLPFIIITFLHFLSVC